MIFQSPTANSLAVFHSSKKGVGMKYNSLGILFYAMATVCCAESFGAECPKVSPCYETEFAGCIKQECYGATAGCAECLPGWARYFAGTSNEGTCTFSTYMCNPPACPSCSGISCPPTQWVDDGDFGQEREIFECRCGSCETKDYEKRCKSGYYGNGGDDCYNCKTNTGNSNATSNAGARLITDCYVPTGSVASNPSGVFEYMNDCYYN
jgi:hypothetical protein